MYFVNVLLFKFYFYIKNISLLYFYSFFFVACVLYFIASNYSRRGDWNTAKGWSSIFSCRWCFLLDVYLRKVAKMYLAVGHEAEMITFSSGEAFWGAHMHPAMGICAGAPCRSAAAHRDRPSCPLLCRISRCRPLAHRFFFLEQRKAALSLNSNYFLNFGGTSKAKENRFALPGSPKIASN